MLESNSSGDRVFGGSAAPLSAALFSLEAKRRCAPGKRNAINSEVWSRAPVRPAGRCFPRRRRSGFLSSDSVQFSHGIALKTILYASWTKRSQMVQAIILQVFYAFCALGGVQLSRRRCTVFATQVYNLSDASVQLSAPYSAASLWATKHMAQQKSALISRVRVQVTAFHLSRTRLNLGNVIFSVQRASSCGMFFQQAKAIPTHCHSIRKALAKLFELYTVSSCYRFVEVTYAG